MPTIYTGTIWNIAGPVQGAGGAAARLSVHESGALVVEHGKIAFCGDVAAARKAYGSARVVDCSDRILMPGFVDTHLHMPQLDIIGSPSQDLLDWLNQSTFPKEAEFRDPLVAADGAKRLVRLLLENGITLSGIFAASFEVSAAAIFEQINRSGLKAVIGKVSMNRGAPKQLLQSIQSDYDSNRRLIAGWHGRCDRMYYALTPRFAPTCSVGLLESLASLRTETPSLYVQTHLSETRSELAEVKRLFPGAKDYLDVYDRAGLNGRRTIYGHGIYLSSSELRRIISADAAIAHCPTSNAFLGSGTMRLRHYLARGVTLGLGSDIGGGTSLSPWQTMAGAFLSASQRNERITPATALYLATLGGAQCFDMADVTGSLDVGKDADFIVLNPESSPYLRSRFNRGEDPENLLLLAMLTGNEHLTDAVYVQGVEVFSRSHRESAERARPTGIPPK